MLGVVGEQAQHHLQAAAAGAQQRDLGVRVDLVRGQFRGDRVAGGFGFGQGLLRPGDLLPGGGISRAFLVAGDGRVGEHDGVAFPRGRQGVLGLPQAGVRALRAGLSITLVLASIAAA